jgi:hypothetical protein
MVWPLEHGQVGDDHIDHILAGQRQRALPRQICFADLPALITAFSSSVLRCLGAGPSVASTI